MADKHIDQQAGDQATQIGSVKGSVTIVHNYPPTPSPPAPQVETAPTGETIPDSPYRGLFAFRPEHAHLFFGRKIFTAQLIQAVESRSFVTVLGASGSGKSSVVFAGLVPALLNRPGEPWLFTTFRPGDNPFLGLAQALVPLIEPELSTTKQIGEARDMADSLRQGRAPLSDYLQHIHTTQPDRRLLIVADQFEELYTLTRDKNIRQTFLETLLYPIQSNPSKCAIHNSPFTIILTLRADFIGQASLYPPLADALNQPNTTNILGPMTRDGMAEAIKKPAALLGVQFETGLVNRILDDVGVNKMGNLPLLEFALTQLWEHQIDSQLTHTAYEAIGRVEGALTTYAEKVYTDLDETEREEARRILVRLVHLGEGREDTRRLMPGIELDETDWPLVQKMANTRLVVTNQDLSGQQTVELTHEALIRNWSRLRNWVDSNREALLIHRRLSETAKEWEQNNRDESYLYRGVLLMEVSEWAKEHGEDLNESERDFLQASKKLISTTQYRILLPYILLALIISIGTIAVPVFNSPIPGEK